MANQTKVRLLSCTAYPLETLWVVWEQSRTKNPVPTAKELHDYIYDDAAGILNGDPRSQEEVLASVLSTFEKIVEMKMPLAEMIEFVFLVEDMPIALREQIVRHRVGHKFDDRLGADLIPEAHEDTYWSQSMRVIGAGDFYDAGNFYLPEEVERQGETAVEYYKYTMLKIQEAYNELQALGVPMEYARNVLPVAFQHRMVWKTNLAALLHVLSKRVCWVAQLDMWYPVVRDMVNELCTHVSPIFKTLLTPPCIKKGKWVGCAFKKENEDFVTGKTKFDGPCPLYMWKHQDEVAQLHMDEKSIYVLNNVGPDQWNCMKVEDIMGAQRWVRRINDYAALWNFHPFTADMYDGQHTDQLVNAKD